MSKFYKINIHVIMYFDYKTFRLGYGLSHIVFIYSRLIKVRVRAMKMNYMQTRVQLVTIMSMINNSKP